jgi:hypothetical protein
VPNRVPAQAAVPVTSPESRPAAARAGLPYGPPRRMPIHRGDGNRHADEERTMAPNLNFRNHGALGHEPRPVTPDAAKALDGVIGALADLLFEGSPNRFDCELIGRTR